MGKLLNIDSSVMRNKALFADLIILNTFIYFNVTSSDYYRSEFLRLANEFTKNIASKKRKCGQELF
ncbi:hypothetical protein ICE98_01184 [Lactococcus lactis]|nr:hypothetical protein [Lactococcus lactis]